MQLVPANQKVPAHYLNRKFAMAHNLPKMAKLADATRSFPSLGAENALALAALALARVEVALAGQAQASDAVVAGSVAAWGAELTAARADANDALAAVAASFPTFQSAATINATLQAKAATDLGKAKYPAPSQLSASWHSGNVAPTGAASIVTTVANNTAISKNFKTLAGGTDADSDVIHVVEINGQPIDYTDGNAAHLFKVDGKQFTFTKATQLVTAAAQLPVHTWVGTFVLGDDEGGRTAVLNWSIQNLA